MIKFSQQEINAILDMFLNQKKSRSQIAKTIGRDISVINRILIENNIDYNNSQNKYGRKYFFNQDYFEHIDCSEKAYWLGFIYADGYITRKNSFGCDLQLQDKEHLHKFLQAVECSSFKCIRIEKNSARLTLTNTIFINCLIDKGIVYQKSYDNSIKIWNNIPEGYKKILFGVYGMEMDMFQNLRLELI